MSSTKQKADGDASLSEYLVSDEESADGLLELLDALEQIQMAEKTMTETPQDIPLASLPTEKAGPSTPGFKAQPPAQVKVGPASLTENDRMRLSHVKSVKGQFLRAIGYDTLVRDKPEVKFQWFPGEHTRDAEERVNWVQRQTKTGAFVSSGKSEVLIMECDASMEAKQSPMTRFAQLYLEDAVNRENALPIFVWAHGIQQYLPVNGVILMIGKVLTEGFDPELAIPDNVLVPLDMLAALLTSHRRRSPISIVIDSVGVFDAEPALGMLFATHWRIVCQRFIDMTKSNAPDLKPLKVLLVNPVESNAINQIKLANPRIPVLKCSTAEEFREEFPDGRMPPAE